LLCGCVFWGESVDVRIRRDREIFTKFRTTESGFVFEAYESRDAVAQGDAYKMEMLRSWIKDKGVCPTGYALAPRRIEKHNEKLVLVIYEGKCT
jgi:hypothetical protein